MVVNSDFRVSCVSGPNAILTCRDDRTPAISHTGLNNGFLFASRIRKEEEDREREQKRIERQIKKQERQQSRIAKRRAKRVEKKRKEEERQMQMKIALEERKILIAQRKLETIRLMSELFNRVKVRKRYLRQLC